MGSYTRRTHTMGLPKAIQKEAWSERTNRNRAGAWCPDRRGNLDHPCRLEHRTAHQRSWPPRAEVRNALGTRGSARGGELPHRGRPALGRLVASFSAGKEDGDCPPRPQGSKASLRGDSSGSLDVCCVDWVRDRKGAIVVSPHQGEKDGPSQPYSTPRAHGRGPHRPLLPHRRRLRTP